MNIIINDMLYNMLYDPGAAESLISKEVLQQIGSPVLESISNLVTYTGVHIATLGKSIVDVLALGHRLSLSLPVVV